MKEFLGEAFVFGGTVEKPSPDEGVYKGVYLIVRPENFMKSFNGHSKAGKWKGKDPTVSIGELEKNWIDDADILYIGESKNVQERIRAHIDFWNGKTARAYGGRFIAQLQNYTDLEVWHLPCDDGKAKRSVLLQAFEARYNKLPFANLRH